MSLINVKKGLCRDFSAKYDVAVNQNNKARIKLYRYFALQNKKEYSPVARFYYKISQLSLSLFKKSDFQVVCKHQKLEFLNEAKANGRKLKKTDAENYAKLTLKFFSKGNLLKSENGNEKDGAILECEELKNLRILPAYLIKYLDRI